MVAKIVLGIDAGGLKQLQRMTEVGDRGGDVPLNVERRPDEGSLATGVAAEAQKKMGEVCDHFRVGAAGDDEGVVRVAAGINPDRS